MTHEHLNDEQLSAHLDGERHGEPLRRRPTGRREPWRPRSPPATPAGRRLAAARARPGPSLRVPVRPCHRRCGRPPWRRPWPGAWPRRAGDGPAAGGAPLAGARRRPAAGDGRPPRRVAAVLVLAVGVPLGLSQRRSPSTPIGLPPGRATSAHDGRRRRRGGDPTATARRPPPTSAPSSAPAPSGHASPRPLASGRLRQAVPAERRLPSAGATGRHRAAAPSAAVALSATPPSWRALPPAPRWPRRRPGRRPPRAGGHGHLRHAPALVVVVEVPASTAERRPGRGRGGGPPRVPDPGPHHLLTRGRRRPGQRGPTSGRRDGVAPTPDDPQGDRPARANRTSTGSAQPLPTAKPSRTASELCRR